MILQDCEKFVGPMPIHTFLAEFVPKAQESRPTGEISFTHSTVSKNENEFIKAIEASGLCPKLKFVNTTSSPYPDGEHRLNPDISIYSDLPNHSYWHKHLAGSKKTKSLNWRAVALWIENKNDDGDMFISLEELRKDERHLESHIQWTQPAYKTCEQLIAYASAHHCAQFRVFSFSVFLFGEMGRLLRWDRSGVIYTEPFKWATQPETLFEFLWRFNFLSDFDRGFDTTVTSVPDDEAEAAISELRTYEGFEKVRKADLHKLLVRDDHAADSELRSFITPGAVWCSESFFGRSTFGYIAYDVARKDLVYLKDSWRINLPGIQKEGDTYHKLHNAQVPHIAKFGLAGDVPLSPEHSEVSLFAAQRTRTQDYLKGSEGGHNWCPGRPAVDPFVHYRLVLETLGRPLNTFISTRQLCEVIRDAVTAHSAAYERAGILHRDVSSGNIMIGEDGYGVLIDWELSKQITKNVEEKGKRHSRTGTWKFISIWRLLDPSSRPHGISDDLESFFWVLLYEIAKYRNTGDMDMAADMQYVFDMHSGSNGLGRGGSGKFSFLQGCPITPGTIEVLVETPCRSIIEEFRSLFQDLYRHVQPQYEVFKKLRLKIEDDQMNDPRVQDARRKLCSSDWVLSIFDRHLAETTTWNVLGDGSLCRYELRLHSSESRDRQKRKAEDSDSDEEETFSKRRKG
ncbi:hypothetical protein B0F90DRAFT_1201281 [Multifurca ochricompacta]|uniref:Protein kinase domain-containing protein n=1 Tax=Multifurca ochricompacta TaxID=376703 RepID=A0AAD4QI49_9AGAM|nr:hypothetical protein B0F90DRAFT_1201281 [Multifurca ochricompacta]